MSQSTEKSLGQVLYEAFAAGSFSFRKRDWASLAPQAQADFEREAQAVAAVVREQCAQACEQRQPASDGPLKLVARHNQIRQKTYARRHIRHPRACACRLPGGQGAATSISDSCMQIAGNMGKMREAFEAWISNNGEWPQAVDRGRDGYKLMQTASAWRGWKAAVEFQAQEIEALRAARAVAAEQASDEGLWFEATSITEAYLQQALRRIAKAIESQP